MPGAKAIAAPRPAVTGVAWAGVATAHAGALAADSPADGLGAGWREAVR